MINHIGFVVPVHKPFLWFLTNASQILDEIHFKLVGFNLVSWWNTSDEMQTALFTSAGAAGGNGWCQTSLGGDPFGVRGLLCSPAADRLPHLFHRVVNPIPGLCYPHKPRWSGFELV